MKLLLHIGAAKAGSTTIQESLFLNQQALSAQGVEYWQPSSRKVPPPRVLSNLFEPPHKPLLPKERLHFKTREESRAWSRENWDAMAAHVQSRQPALTILSSESLYYLAPGQILDELRKVFSDITILMYIRDPVQLYRSTLDQLIRDGARLGELPLPAGVTLEAADRLTRYLRQLGPDKVILRRFDRSCFTGGDLIADLYEQISLLHGAPLTPEVPVGSVNESFCAAATLWVLSMNEGFERFSAGNDATQIRLRQQLLDRIRSAPALQRLSKLADPPAEICEWIRTVNRVDIEFFNRHAFNKTLPIEAAATHAPLPPEAEQRQAIRDWLLSQTNPADLAQVIATAVA